MKSKVGEVQAPVVDRLSEQDVKKVLDQVEKEKPRDETLVQQVRQALK